LDGRHDVQAPVDLPIRGLGEPVADLVTGGGVDRGGAVHDAKCALGKWVMSPTSISNRAAPVALANQSGVPVEVVVAPRAEA
jgi:hypothetical protein